MAGQIRRTVVAIGASLVAALAITVLVSRLIAPPVCRAVRIAQAIAAGNLENPIRVTSRGATDERPPIATRLVERHGEVLPHDSP